MLTIAGGIIIAALVLSILPGLLELAFWILGLALWAGLLVFVLSALDNSIGTAPLAIGLAVPVIAALGYRMVRHLRTLSADDWRGAAIFWGGFVGLVVLIFVFELAQPR